MSEVRDNQPGKEPFTDKKLRLAEKKLPEDQKNLYHEILMKRREELQEERPGPVTVPVEERWGLLGAIKRGDVQPPPEESTFLPDVDWEKVRRDFEENPEPPIVRSQPIGDRD